MKNVYTTTEIDLTLENKKKNFDWIAETSSNMAWLQHMLETKSISVVIKKT